MKIYHNNRCRKSREGLAILESSGQSFEIIDYINNPLTFEELEQVIGSLGIMPIELVRKNESIWKENYKNKELSNEEIIKAMVAHPKLIERPIVLKGTRAVIGRPPDTINSIL